MTCKIKYLPTSCFLQRIIILNEYITQTLDVVINYYSTFAFFST